MTYVLSVYIFLFDLFYLLYSTHEKPFHFGGCSFNLDQFYLTLVDVLCGKIEENEVRGYNKIPLHFMITLTEFNCSITVLYFIPYFIFVMSCDVNIYIDIRAGMVI